LEQIAAELRQDDFAGLKDNNRRKGLREYGSTRTDASYTNNRQAASDTQMK